MYSTGIGACGFDGFNCSLDTVSFILKRSPHIRFCLFRKLPRDSADSRSAGMIGSSFISGDKTRCPPVKVLSSQLREGNECQASNGKPEYIIKRLGSNKDNLLRLSVVWMQGTVVEVQSDLNTVLMLDETGNFLVNGVNNVPKGKPCLSPGKYVMIMGVIQSHSPEPVLRAVKMADLSDNATIHRKNWRNEVEDLQQTLP